MTGQPHDDDDAQFDAFLQGKGALAQGLAELKQPEPSAALDAAILARVAADMERGNAANDAAGPADFQPRRWRERWHLPVALAAGVAAFSIALPLWQEDAAQQQAVNMPSQELQIPAVPEVAPAAAYEPAAGAAHADIKAAAVHRDDSLAKRKVESADAARKTAERGHMEAPAMRAQQSAPLMEAAPARIMAPQAAPAPAAPPAPAPAAGMPQAAKPAPIAEQPATVHRFMEEEPRQPAAMLARTEQLLKEGKREEARAELSRLRAAYPDYPVPDTLRDALK